MSKTNLPGFTGEASLYSASNHYYVHGMYQRTEQKVYPADYIDQICLGTCKQDCGIVCAGTSGSGKAGCIRGCMQDNVECNTICRRPGSPPTDGGGGTTGSGGNPCAPGVQCGGGCCPPGTNCSPGGTACCPSPYGYAMNCSGTIFCSLVDLSWISGCSLL
jgi:hypothetical protein